MAHTISNANAKIVNQSTGIVVAGTDVEGGYFTVDKIETIQSTYDYAQVKGALCYVTVGSTAYPAEKFYQFNGTTWSAVEFGEKGVVAEEPNTVVRRDENAGIAANYVTLGRTPAYDNEAITVKYLADQCDEDAVGNTIAKRTEGGNLHANSFIIESTIDGDTHATSKSYVDTLVATRVP